MWSRLRGPFTEITLLVWGGSYQSFWHRSHLVLFQEIGVNVILVFKIALLNSASDHALGLFCSMHFGSAVVIPFRNSKQKVQRQQPSDLTTSYDTRHSNFCLAHTNPFSFSLLSSLSYMPELLYRDSVKFFFTKIHFKHKT